MEITAKLEVEDLVKTLVQAKEGELRVEPSESNQGNGEIESVTVMKNKEMIGAVAKQMVLPLCLLLCRLLGGLVVE